jgi:FkbM family methyltransferase
VEKIKIIFSNLKIIFNYRLLRRLLFPFKQNEFMSYFLDLKYFIKKDNIKLFSLRNFGSSTKSRGVSFFTKEKITTDWIESFKKNSKFLDIGANIGIYSLYAAKLNHDVISIEPEALNFAMLNLNIHDNSFNNRIKAYNFAMHNKNGISDLGINEFNFGKSNHIFDSKNDVHLHYHGVYGMTVDNFLDEIKFEPNHIKIDVDGNELMILKGMKKILRNKEMLSIILEVNIKSEEYITINKLFKENNYVEVESSLIGANVLKEEVFHNIIYSKRN